MFIRLRIAVINILVCIKWEAAICEMYFLRQFNIFIVHVELNARLTLGKTFVTTK